MFAVLYRGFIKPQLESTYQTAWHKMADELADILSLVLFIAHELLI